MRTLGISEGRTPNQAILRCLALGLVFSVSAAIGHSQANPRPKPEQHKSGQEKPQSNLVQPPQIPGMPFVHIVPFGPPKKLNKLPLSSAGGLFSYYGGPVISNIHIVEVLWGSFVDVPSTSGLPQFLTDVVSSNYFDLLSEYGTVGVQAVGGQAGSNQLIGRGVFDGKFTITPSICPGSASNPPPTCNLTNEQIQTELQRQLANLPAPVKDTQSNYDTIYLLYFPPGVHITLGTAPSCAPGGFCAYHASLAGGLPSELPYGVFPDFGPTSACSAGCGQSTSANNMTTATSHELGEAVTDSNIGNAVGDAPPLAWYNNNYGEIGDICNQDQQQITVGTHTYTVQALYSNMQNNCVTAPAQMTLTGPTGVIPGKTFKQTVTVSASSGTSLQYSNTIHFTSSDAQAVLPADYTFDPNADFGPNPGQETHTFSFTLNSLNSQTISATDTLAAPITATTTIDVNHNPDLTLTKTHTGNFTQGQTGARYTLTAGNAGDLPTTGVVTVADTLPSDLTATAMSGTGWTCTPATATCTRADALAASAAYPAITVTVNVSDTAPASITNTASVSGGGEANLSNDVAADPTSVTQLPDLTISISDSGNFSQGGTGVIYTISVTNIASVNSKGTITVTDTLPPSLTATAIKGQGWNCVVATVTCTSTSPITAFNNSLIYVTANVALNAPSSVINTATVSGGGEINTADDTGSDTTAVAGPQPDLTVSISNPGTLSEGQSGVTYTLTANNIGPAASSGTVTVIEVANDLSYTAASGTGWTCTLTPDANCQRSDAVGPNASYPPITVSALVSPNAGSPLIANVYVQGGGDINTSNNMATARSNVNLLPDLTASSGQNSQFAQGQTGASYGLAAFNLGGIRTTGTITLTDTLPAGLTASSMSGTNWNCTLATLTCTTTTQIDSHQSSSSIILTVNVAANAPASVTNTVTVSGGGETYTADDTATDPTQILAAVSFSLTNSNSTVTAGQSASYTFSIASFAPDALTLSCTGLPAMATCAFNPASVIGQAATTMLTIRTVAPTLASANPTSRLEAKPFYAMLFPLFGLLMIGRKPAFRKGRVHLAAALLGLLILAGCGGGGSSQRTLQGGTPAGSYTVTITAADTGAVFQATTSVPLTVNWNGL